MWGAKTSGGYSDNLYRDRNAGGFDSKSRCCCFYLSKSVVVILLVSVIIASGAASVLSIVFGYSQRWTYVVDRSVEPAWNVRTGWLFFNDNRFVLERERLDELNKATFILGLVCMIMNGFSAVVALWTGLKAMCGRVGRGYICFSLIFSVLLIGSMIAYYIVTALQVYKYSQRVVGVGRFPWPDWAWCLGAGSALLWFISSGLVSLMPKKSKYIADEAEFQRQRAADPNRPYQIPAQGTPVNGFVPSSLEPTPSNRPNPPMASQENTDYGEAPVKKSFMPNWTKKGSYNSSTEPDLPAAGRGNLRDRADEIRDRYRNQNKDVEMGNSERPKSAW